MKVVRAAIIDGYENIGRTQELYSHWAARGLKKLQRESLKLGKQHVWLTVNGNTNTAAIPVDCENILFVGIIDQRGRKIPLRLNTAITNETYITDVPCEDKCPKCDQSQSICNDLQISETVELITIEGTVYDKTITKKLYPNGDYFLETRTPVLDLNDNTVNYLTSKEFIQNLDLKPCGCLETTPENLAKIRTCCPDVYGCYYATCDNACNADYGSYMVFEENGLIQFSPNFRFPNVYVEYTGTMPRLNGQLQVPEVAFETLVAWTKFKSVENKSNISMNEKNWFWSRYRVERGNMEKELGRISLEYIIQAAMNTPKLDIWVDPWRECFRRVEATTTSTESTSTTCEVTTTACSNETSVIYIYRDTAYGKKKFTVGASGALMTAGQTQLIINEPKIFSNSLNIVVDGAVIMEDVTGAVSYTVDYQADKIVINILNLDPSDSSINYGVQDGWKMSFTYTKTV